MAAPRYFDPQPFQRSLDDFVAQLRQLLGVAPGGTGPSSAPLLGVQPDGYQALRYGLFSPPDRESFIASPRRRLFNLQNAAALPIGTTGVSNTIALQDTLQQDDGLLIEYIGGSIVVAPAGVITIKDVAIQLVNSTNGLILPLGTPTITTLQPLNADTLQFQPQPLFAARDLDFFARVNTGTGIFAAAQQPLQIILLVTYNATVATTVTQRLFVMYRTVQGLSGA